MSETIAWLHKDHQNAYVITTKVKEIWLAVDPKHVENYTIPLVYANRWEGATPLRRPMSQGGGIVYDPAASPAPTPQPAPASAQPAQGDDLVRELIEIADQFRDDNYTADETILRQAAARIRADHLPSDEQLWATCRAEAKALQDLIVQPAPVDDLVRDLTERAENDPYHGYLFRAAVEQIKELEAWLRTYKCKDDIIAGLQGEVARLTQECDRIKQVEFPRKIDAVTKTFRDRAERAEADLAACRDALEAAKAMRNRGVNLAQTIVDPGCDGPDDPVGEFIEVFDGPLQRAFDAALARFNATVKS